MKTRIISGIVMGVIVAAVIAAGLLWNPIVITVAIALITMGAVYELLHNAAGIKDKASWIGACVFSLLFIFTTDRSLQDKIYSAIPYSADTIISQSTKFYNYWANAFSALVILYFVFAAIMILKNHSDFTLAHIVSLVGLPVPYAYALSCLGAVINHADGIYYLLLLLNFSSVCDMGAYFVGSAIGKHKLCPNISPKKTVEGAIGGIISSIIVTVILALCFGKSIWLPLVLTIPLCILGMIGDLFASAIKRSVGLKDYSNLIPGHGGILDRVDSIIMIVPLMYVLISFGVL